MRPVAVEDSAKLYFPLVGLVARGGRAGGVAAVVVGLGQIVAGLYLCYVTLNALVWVAGLGLFVFGLILALLGGAVLFGAQGRVTHAIAEAEAEADPPRPNLGVEAARTEPPPFWICNHCRRVEAGVSVLSRCMECGKTSAFVQALDEAGRKTAMAVLGLPSQ